MPLILGARRLAIVGIAVAVAGVTTDPQTGVQIQLPVEFSAGAAQ